MTSSSNGERIVGMVQSRMGSSRLPGKALEEIGGVPLVARVCKRVSIGDRIDEAVVVTTKSPTELPMLTRLTQLGIQSFQGSTDDLVVRFHDAAIHFKADIVVRIWGDCPFMDPAVIDLTVNRLTDQQLDYCATFSPARRTFPGGMDLEVYRTDTLGRIRAESEDPFYREFPADYLHANSGEFRIGSVNADVDYSKFNLTVDYMEDLQLARTIHDRLEQPLVSDKVIDFRSVIQLVDQDPELLALDQGRSRNAEYLAKLEGMGE